MQMKIWNKLNKKPNKIDIVLILALLPITIFSVSVWGNEAGDILLFVGLAYCFLKSDIKIRRYMLLLVLVSYIFETASVAAKYYTYSGTIGVPFWIAIGWGILGWLAFSLNKKIKLSDKICIIVFLVASVLATFITKGSWFSIPITLVSLWMLSKASGFKMKFFVIVFFLSWLIDFSGTYFKLWSYGGATGMLSDWVLLGLTYCVFLGVGLWLSKIERENKQKN